MSRRAMAGALGLSLSVLAVVVHFSSGVAASPSVTVAGAHSVAVADTTSVAVAGPHSVAEADAPPGAVADIPSVPTAAIPSVALAAPPSLVGTASPASAGQAAGGTGAGGAVDASPPVAVAGRTDRDRVSIGTPFRYTVEVKAARDIELIVPVLGGQLGEFTVTDFGEEPVTESDGHVVLTRWYTLVTYRPGFLFIPGLTVQYRTPGGELERVDGKDVGIRVLSLVEQDPGAADVRDIKGPVVVPFDWTPVLVGVAVLAGLAGLGLVGSRLLRRINAAAAPPPPRPPDVVALEALALLRHRRLAEPEERAEWYVALSAIVRTYIEARFGLRAPEMTTEEFMHVVQHDSPLVPEHRQLLGEFLTECDLVKFARHMPALEDVERVYAAAKRFIDETCPEARPEPVAREFCRAA